MKPEHRFYRDRQGAVLGHSRTLIAVECPGQDDMPIYEYLCDDCGAKFDKFVRHPGSEEVLCPSCGKDRLTQQFTTFTSPVKGRFKDTSRPPWADNIRPEGYVPDH
jgi:putative FmdB family regulatory protein